jgi:hypothetical protein
MRAHHDPVDIIGDVLKKRRTFTMLKAGKDSARIRHRLPCVAPILGSAKAKRSQRSFQSIATGARATVFRMRTAWTEAAA